MANVKLFKREKQKAWLMYKTMNKYQIWYTETLNYKLLTKYWHVQGVIQPTHSSSDPVAYVIG